MKWASSRATHPTATSGLQTHVHMPMCIYILKKPLISTLIKLTAFSKHSASYARNCGELGLGKAILSEFSRVFSCAFCVCDETVWLKKLRGGQSLFSIQATVHHWGKREQELEAETILAGSVASTLLLYIGQDHLFREWCHPWWTLLTHQSR